MDKATKCVHGVISPLLANLYLNSLDHGVNDDPKLEAKLVRYADDFVLLCPPGHGKALYQRLERYLQSKGLKLNLAKTRVINAHRERFQFLGFEFSWRRSKMTGRAYSHVEPSKKGRQHLRDAVRKELNHWTTGRSCAESVRTVNRIVRGWSQYYHYGHCVQSFVCMQDWLRQRLRKWLWKKYDRKLGLNTFFTNARLEGQYKLYKLPVHAPYTR